jgi:DNA-binding MarR family transcriptional regulator
MAAFRRVTAVGASARLPPNPFLAAESSDEAATRAEKQSFQYCRHSWLSAVGKDPELTGADLRVAIMIWELTNADWGYAWPSLSYIATQMSLDRSTVVRSVKKLAQRGWIVRSRNGRFRSNEYRIAIGSAVVSERG